MPILKLSCFWSKDEILHDSWFYSPIFALIAWFTIGLTAFYMFRMYLLTFDGYLHIHFPDSSSLSSTKNSSFYSISLCGKGTLKKVNRNFFSWRNNRFGSIIEMVNSIDNLFSSEIEFWYGFLFNAFFSVSIALFGLFITSIFYGSIYSSFKNLG